VAAFLGRAAKVKASMVLFLRTAHKRKITSLVGQTKTSAASQDIAGKKLVDFFWENALDIRYKVNSICKDT